MVYDPLAGYSEYSKAITNKPTALGSATDYMQSGMYSGLEFAAKEAGFDSVSDFAKAKAASNLAEAQRYTPTGPQRVEDIHGVGDFVDYAGNIAIQQAPILGTMLGAGAAGALIAGPMGALAGAVSATAPMHLGEAATRQKEMGIDDPSKVWGAAAVNTALDVIPVGTFLNTARKLGGGTFAKAVARGAAAEGTTEAIQGAVTDYAAGITPSLEEEYVMNRVNEAVAGAMLGGGMTGAAHAVGSVTDLPGAAYDTVRDTDFDPMQGIKNAATKITGYQDVEHSPFQAREEAKDKVAQSADLGIEEIRNQLSREGWIYPEQEEWLIANYSSEDINTILDIDEGREVDTPEMEVSTEEDLERYQQEEIGIKRAAELEQPYVYDEAVAQEEAEPYLDTETQEQQFKDVKDVDTGEVKEQPDAYIDSDVGYTVRNMRIGKLNERGEKWDKDEDYLLNIEAAKPYRTKTHKKDFTASDEYIAKLNTSGKREYRKQSLIEGIEQDVRRDMRRESTQRKDTYGSIAERIEARNASVAADIMASRKNKQSDFYQNLVKLYDEGRNPEAILNLYDSIESRQQSGAVRSGVEEFDYEDKARLEVPYKKSTDPKKDTTKISQGFVPLKPNVEGEYKRLNIIKAVKARKKELTYSDDTSDLNDRQLTTEAVKSVLTEYLDKIDLDDRAINVERRARTEVIPRFSESPKLRSIYKIVERIQNGDSMITKLPGRDVKGNRTELDILAELDRVKGDPQAAAKNLFHKLNLTSVMKNKKFVSTIADTTEEAKVITDEVKMENMLAEVGVSAKFVESLYKDKVDYQVTPAEEYLAITPEEKLKAKKESIRIQLGNLDKQLSDAESNKRKNWKLRDWEQMEFIGKDDEGKWIKQRDNTRLISDEEYQNADKLTERKEFFADYSGILKQELEDRADWELSKKHRQDVDRGIKRLESQIYKKELELEGEGREFEAAVGKQAEEAKQKAEVFDVGQYDPRDEPTTDVKGKLVEPTAPEEFLTAAEEMDIAAVEDKQAQMRVDEMGPKEKQKIETQETFIPEDKPDEANQKELINILNKVFIDGKYEVEELSQKDRENLRASSAEDIRAAKDFIEMDYSARELVKPEIKPEVKPEVKKELTLEEAKQNVADLNKAMFQANKSKDKAIIAKALANLNKAKAIRDELAGKKKSVGMSKAIDVSAETDAWKRFVVNSNLKDSMGLLLAETKDGATKHIIKRVHSLLNETDKLKLFSELTDKEKTDNNITDGRIGFYTPYDNMAAVDDTAGKLGSRVIIHEAIHAVTYNALKSYDQGKPISKRIQTFGKEIESIQIAMKEFYAADPKKVKEFAEYFNYATTNVHEFMAVALTDTKVMALMKQVPYKRKTLFNKFADSVRKFLGLSAKDQNALNAMLDVSGEVFSEVNYLDKFDKKFELGDKLPGIPSDTEGYLADTAMAKVSSPEIDILNKKLDALGTEQSSLMKAKKLDMPFEEFKAKLDSINTRKGVINTQLKEARIAAISAEVKPEPEPKPKPEVKPEVKPEPKVIQPLVISKDYRPAQQYSMQLYNEYINKSEKAILAKHKQLYTKSMSHDYGPRGDNINFADADLTALRSLMKKRNIPMPKDQQGDFARSTLSDLQIEFNQVDGLVKELEFELSSRDIVETTDDNYEQWMITPAEAKRVETKISKLKEERTSIENKLKAVETEIKPEIKSEAKPKSEAINIWSTNKNGYEGLSNFTLRHFTIGPATFRSVEHAFQLEKLKYAKKTDAVQRIKQSVKKDLDNPKVSGAQLKNKMKRINSFIDMDAWTKNNSIFMEKALRAMLDQNPEAKQLLDSTKGSELTHKSNYGKDFWTTEFPRLLTKIRDEGITVPIKPTAKTKPDQEVETDKIPFDDAEYAKQKAKHKAGLSKSFTQKFGKVGKSEMSTEQTQVLADKYLKDLGIDAKIVDGQEALKLANKLGIDDAEFGMKFGSLHGFASASPNTDGSYSVYINPAMQGKLRQEILEHELGHIVMYGSALNPSSKEASSVLKEFTAWLDKQGKDSNLVTDLIKSKKSPEAALLYMQQMGSGLKMKDLPQNLKDYMLDFDEWFADQAGKALARNTVPRTVVQKFFSRLVKALKKVFGADDKVEAYIDRLRAKHQTNIPGVLTPELAALSRSFETNLGKSDAWKKAKDMLQNVMLDKDYNMRRLADGNIDAFNELADLMFKPRGTVKTDNSYWHNKLLYLAKFDTRATDIMRGATRDVQTKVMRELYNENLPDGSALQRTVKIRGLLRDLKQYMEDEGIKVPTRKNYFPNIVDQEYTSEHHDEFVEMMERYPDSMEGIAAKWNKDVESRARYRQETVSQDELIEVDEVPQLLYENIVRGDLMDEAVSEGQQTPHIRFLKHRVIDFLKGADKVIWKDSYLQHSVTDATSTYIMQVVKRVEYSKRFGKLNNAERKAYINKKKREGGKIHYSQDEVNNFDNEAGWTNRLEVLLDRARDEGATDKEIQHARDYVAAEMGTHGRDTAKWLNEKLGIPMPQSHAPINTGLQKVTSTVMSVANVWVLGLSTITSLLDPIGIAVRSGSITQGLSSMTQGIKSAIGKDRNELEILAEAVGSISDIATKEALAHGYNMVNMTPSVRKMNDKFFHIIGLEQWTRTTRLMAVDAAQGFIKRHDVSNPNSKPNKHSARFLKELGLQEGDVKYGANGKVKVLTYEQYQKASETEQARDDRVKSAIAEFVDTSILRPSPSQRPAWASDPHFALLFHLKSFMYSFQKTILNPLWREAKQGNYAPLLAVSMYLPAGIAVGLVKDMFKTFGDDEDDWTPDYKENWDVGDYMFDGVEKSGLTGITQPIFDIHRSQKYGGTWVGGLFGPALEPWDTFNGLPVPLNYTWNNLTN